MTDNEYFRLGLVYLLFLYPKGIKSRIAANSNIDRNNFYSMLSGRRPFPQKKCPLIANCLNHTVRDIERVGMDVAEGVKNSLHQEIMCETTILLPEMCNLPDLDIYAVNTETLKSYIIGNGWTLEDGAVMAEFKQIPCYQSRFIFRPKVISKPLSSDDEDHSDDS